MWRWHTGMDGRQCMWRQIMRWLCREIVTRKSRECFWIMNYFLLSRTMKYPLCAIKLRWNQGLKYASRLHNLYDTKRSSQQGNRWIYNMYLSKLWLRNPSYTHHASSAVEMVKEILQGTDSRRRAHREPASVVGMPNCEGLASIHWLHFDGLPPRAQ